MTTFELTETQKKILEIYKDWAPEFLLENISRYIMKDDFLLKSKIPDDLLEEMDDYSETLRDDHILHSDLDSTEKIKYAKAIIKEHKLLLTTFSFDIYTELMNTISEVAEDSKTLKTKKGQRMLASINWMKELRKSMPSDMKETIRMGLSCLFDGSDPSSIIIGGYSLTMTPAELEGYFMSLNPPVKPFFLFLDGTADNFIKQLDKELINSAKKWMNETANTMPKDLKDNIQIGYTILNDEAKPIDIIITGHLGTKTREEVESYFMNLNPPVTPSFNLR
ncbi:MAG: hypothetical protein J6V54_05180 [Bacteroidales bacterium]|nr:hypothetical protein [Bacteroidales bacterium]